MFSISKEGIEGAHPLLSINGDDDTAFIPSGGRICIN